MAIRGKQGIGEGVIKRPVPFRASCPPAIVDKHLIEPRTFCGMRVRFSFQPYGAEFPLKTATACARPSSKISGAHNLGRSAIAAAFPGKSSSDLSCEVEHEPASKTLSRQVNSLGMQSTCFRWPPVASTTSNIAALKLLGQDQAGISAVTFAFPKRTSELRSYQSESNKAAVSLPYSIASGRALASASATFGATFMEMPGRDIYELPAIALALPDNITISRPDWMQCNQPTVAMACEILNAVIKQKTRSFEIHAQLDRRFARLLGRGLPWYALFSHCRSFIAMVVRGGQAFLAPARLASSIPDSCLEVKR